MSAPADAHACPYCGDGARARTLVARERLFGMPGNFTYAECGGCGALRLLDAPPDLAPYYPADRYYSLAPPAAGLRGALQRAAERRGVTGAGVAGAAAAPLLTPTSASGLHRWLRAAGVGPAACVLDVGCGEGALLDAMARAGYRSLTGVDPFARRERSGPPVTVRRARLDESGPETLGTFDLVMLHHVLEHLDDPGRALGRARALLAPGGHVLVRVPVVPSAAWERWGMAWAQLDAPRHLTIPSERGLVALAARHGLALAGSAYDSTAFQFWGSRLCATSPEPLADAVRRLGWLGKRRGWWAARRANAERRGDQAAYLFAVR